MPMAMEDFQNMPTFQFPPGVRFHPSDEELIVYYLHNKVNSKPLPAAVVGEIELYNHNPWELPDKALFGEDEWYFFSPRERKYPNGARPNRTAASGYWKATGTDKPITGSCGARIGVKKALVFYIGKPPNGVKTEWIMIEYRIPDNLVRSQRSKGSMRLDDWVLCRIRQKGNMSKNSTQDNSNSLSPNNKGEEEEETHTLSNDFSPSLNTHNNNNNTNTNTNTPPFEEFYSDYFLSKDCQLLAKLLVAQDFPQIQSSTSQNSNNTIGNAVEYSSSMESQGENSYYMGSLNQDNGYGNMPFLDKNENDFLPMEIPPSNTNFYESHDMFFNGMSNMHGLDNVSQFDERLQH